MTAAPLLLSVFPGFAVGGAQMRFATVANRLGREWRHALVSLDGDRACAARLDPALDVTWPEVALRKGDTLGNLRAIRAALRALRPDALLTHNWGSMEWALANLLPVVPRHVHVEDGFGPEERSTQLPRRVWTRRLALRRCTTVLPSRTLLTLATDTWRLPPARLRFVPNGIDLGRFRATDRAPREVPVIGTVAGLRPEKNVARLLHAFARVRATRPVRLEIAGDGPERPALEALAAQLGLHDSVRFLGAVADPAPLYAGWDVFALSSDTEQMPLTLLEAMASGLPAAATAVGDVPALLGESAARFAVPLEADALADALLALLADRALRARVGAANRARVERDYDETVMTTRWRSLLEGRSTLPSVARAASDDPGGAATRVAPAPVGATR